MGSGRTSAGGKSAGPTVPALWTLLTATEVGRLQLAVATGRMAGGDQDLAEAREDLEWARPDLAATGLTVVLRDPDLDQVLAYRQKLDCPVRGSLSLDLKLQEQHEPYDTVIALSGRRP